MQFYKCHPLIVGVDETTMLVSASALEKALESKLR